MPFFVCFMVIVNYRNSRDPNSLPVYPSKTMDFARIDLSHLSWNTNKSVVSRCLRYSFNILCHREYENALFDLENYFVTIVLYCEL